MADRLRWIRHIKDLRAEHGVGIVEAERIALSDPQWRRWVEHQVNSDSRCRKMALGHISLLGEESVLYQDGDVLKIR